MDVFKNVAQTADEVISDASSAIADAGTMSGGSGGSLRGISVGDESKKVIAEGSAYDSGLDIDVFRNVPVSMNRL